jgi:hypothetical protein
VFAARLPLKWIVTVTDRLARETGILRTADLEDLVIITYIGLLDNLDSQRLNRVELLARSRTRVVTWVWEQGARDQPLGADRRNG